VRADAYDEHYRTACAGYEAWTPSEEREIAPRYVFVFKTARVPFWPTRARFRSRTTTRTW
jgi:hypothetical protein